MYTTTEEERRRRQAEALMRQYGDPNGSPGAQAYLAERAAQPRTYNNGGHWAGTHTPISDQDLAAGLNTASDRDVMGGGNYGFRGWSKRHPLGVMGLFTAAAFGGAALAGAGAGGAAGGAGAGGTAGGVGGAAAGGLGEGAGSSIGGSLGNVAGAGAGGGAGGSSLLMKALPIAGNMMSNNQQSAPNYAPPPSYQPVQFRDTFKESQEKRKQRLANSLKRRSGSGYV